MPDLLQRPKYMGLIMRKSLFAATAALSLLSTGAMADTRNLELDPFNRVDIATGLTAIITHGETQSLRIEAQSGHALDRIVIRVKNGELRASLNTNLLDIILSGGLLNNFLFKDAATLHITLPEFVGASASSGGEVSADLAKGNAVAVSASSGGHVSIDRIEAGTLSVDASSGGGVTLAGTCDMAELDFSSGAGISAQELACDDVSVQGSSGASARIGAEGDVTGSISSGANVRLYGTPETVNVQSSSGGNLKIQN